MRDPPTTQQLEPDKARPSGAISPRAWATAGSSRSNPATCNSPTAARTPAGTMTGVSPQEPSRLKRATASGPRLASTLARHSLVCQVAKSTWRIWKTATASAPRQRLASIPNRTNSGGGVVPSSR